MKVTIDMDNVKQLAEKYKLKSQKMKDKGIINIMEIFEMGFNLGFQTHKSISQMKVE